MCFKLMQRVADTLGLALAEKTVLYILARHARDDGGNPNPPSVETLAEKVGITGRSVRRVLRTLEDSGLIRAATSKVGGKQGPTRYLIVTDKLAPFKGEDTVSAPIDEGRTECPPTPDTVSAPPDTESAEESLRDSKESVCRAHEEQLHLQQFQEFMTAYPKPDNPGEARIAYADARRIASHEEIMEGVLRYQQACAGSIPRWIKSPANWLKAEAWKNPPVLNVIAQEAPNGYPRQAKPDRDQRDAARREPLARAALRRMDARSAGHG